MMEILQVTLQRAITTAPSEVMKTSVIVDNGDGVTGLKIKLRIQLQFQIQVCNP